MPVKGAALRDEVFVKNVTLIGEKGRGGAPEPHQRAVIRL
jgi:hypothetical protein